MKPASAMFTAAVAGLFAFAFAVQGDDDVEKIPGRDNAILKSILSPQMRIEGRWNGVIRRGYEEHMVTIDADPDQKGSYRLKFYSWTDIAGASKANRKGTVADGVISLNEPIKGFGISKDSFGVLYAVRADGKDYLLPAVNAADLKTVEEIKPRIAYQFQRRTAR